MSPLVIQDCGCAAEIPDGVIVPPREDYPSPGPTVTDAPTLTPRACPPIEPGGCSLCGPGMCVTFPLGSLPVVLPARGTCCFIVSSAIDDVYSYILLLLACLNKGRYCG